MKIAVLSVRLGSGHVVLAENYAALLRPHHEVTCFDAFDTEASADIAQADPLFWSMLEHAPALWRWLHANWSSIPGLRWANIHLAPRRFLRTAARLREFAPDLIITNHPAATGIACLYKRRDSPRTLVYTAFSDWHVQPFWMFPGVDRYFTATTHQADALRAAGVPHQSIEHTGILTRSALQPPPSRADARRQLGLSPDRLTILVMNGAVGWNNTAFLRVLAQVPVPATALVLGARAQQAPPDGPVTIQHHDNVPSDLYMAAADVFLGKPGGLSVAEAFSAGIPAILGFPVPGHEEWNLRDLSRDYPVAALPSSQPSQFLASFLPGAQTWRLEERTRLRRFFRDCPARILGAIPESSLQHSV